MTSRRIPIVGDVVLYHDEYRDRPRASCALVVYVHTPLVVDLSVFVPHASTVMPRTSIVMVEPKDESDAAKRINRWSWRKAPHQFQSSRARQRRSP